MDNSTLEALKKLVQARQAAQQANVLPTSKQPINPEDISPSSEGLQKPLLSPEDLIGAGVGSAAAKALGGSADALTGSVKAGLPKLRGILSQAIGAIDDMAPAAVNALKHTADEEEE